MEQPIYFLQNYLSQDLKRSWNEVEASFRKRAAPAREQRRVLCREMSFRLRSLSSALCVLLRCLVAYKALWWENSTERRDGLARINFLIYFLSGLPFCSLGTA